MSGVTQTRWFAEQQKSQSHYKLKAARINPSRFAYFGPDPFVILLTNRNWTIPHAIIKLH